MELNEIPVIVLEQVRNKWANIRTLDDLDWSRCALCNFLSDRWQILACDHCPLTQNFWCTANANTSRIHPSRYMKYDQSGNNRVYTVSRWLDAVQEFLEYINAEIDRRRDESCM